MGIFDKLLGKKYNKKEERYWIAHNLSEGLYEALYLSTEVENSKFINDPVGKRINILDTFRTDVDTKCPACREINGPGATVRVLDSNTIMIIYECTKEKRFHFCGPARRY